MAKGAIGVELRVVQTNAQSNGANAMQRDITKGLAAGFFRYLTKPIQVREFMDVLNAALDSHNKRLLDANQTAQMPGSLHRTFSKAAF